MKLQLTVLFSLFIISCGGSGGGGAGDLPVEGVDLTGVYRLSRVSCVNSAGTAVTATANISVSSPTSTMTINKNQFSTQTLSGSCSSLTKGKIIFSDDSTVDITGVSTTTSTQGSCAFTTTLVPQSGGTITPSSTTATINHNGTPPDFLDAGYVIDDDVTIIGIFSTFTVSGSPTDLCFIVYERI